MNIKTELLLGLKESESIKQFVKDSFGDNNYFVDNGQSRRYSSLTRVETPISNLAKKIREESFLKLGIKDFKEEPIYGIFLGVNTLGGSVHQHTDPTIEGHYHFRLNYMVSKPELGGMPVINDVEYKIEERESWINIASQWRHMSTPVSGNKPRIVLSLGSYVKKDIIDELYKKLNNL